MNLTTRISAVIMMIFGVMAVIVPASSASVRPPHHVIKPVVSVNVSMTGVETTAAPVVKGEILQAFGPTTGKFEVLSVTPDGPLNKITMSGYYLQLNDVTDFHILSVPIL